MKSTVLEIIVVVTVCCLLLGAMMGGNPLSTSAYIIESAANAVVATIGCCLAICALVMKNQRRAFSIGFIVPILLYGVTLVQSGKDDFDLNKRPTHEVSEYLRGLYAKISRDVVLDMETQQEIEDYASLTLKERAELRTLFMKIPTPASFIYFGQLLVLMVLGYCGANFARWAYWIDSKPRRTTE